MKHTRFWFAIIVLVGLFIQPARADSTTNHIVISEVQTGSASSASQEFVELYNPTDQPVALDGWKVEYRPASATSTWSNHTGAGLVGSIPADGYYLIAPTAYLPAADAAFSSGLAQGGGSLRLVDSTAKVVDLLGWGNAVEFETKAAPAPAAGQSLERLPGTTNETGGNWVDSDNNQADFLIRTSADPQNSASPLEIPGIGNAVAVSSTPTNPSQPGLITTSDDSPLVINELFVDPAAPLTDSKDEFIELYNPGSSAINLTGFQLKTGTNFHDSYTLPAATIAPGGYQVYYSSQTKLSLTNTGGAAELLDAKSNLVDESATYDGSLTGLSFSRFGDDWQWSTTLTPGASNVLTAPSATADAATKPSKVSTAKKISTKTIKATKVKAPKATKTGAATNLTAAAQSSGLAARWLIRTI